MVMTHTFIYTDAPIWPASAKQAIWKKVVLKSYFVFSWKTQEPYTWLHASKWGILQMYHFSVTTTIVAAWDSLFHTLSSTCKVTCTLGAQWLAGVTAPTLHPETARQPKHQHTDRGGGWGRRRHWHRCIEAHRWQPGKIPVKVDILFLKKIPQTLPLKEHEMSC